MNRLLLLLLLLACSLNAAHAGRTCATKKMSASNFIAGMNLADKTRAALDASGAQVAVVARVGQDLSRYGLRYSHMGWVWRDAANGRWTVVHELNQCGTAHSALYRQGLGNFFLDDLFAYEAEVFIPAPSTQKKLVVMLASALPLRMHAARYNMLVYAFATDYQNSNQWLLETYAAAASELQIGDRVQAQAWLKLAGFRPITVNVPAATRLGARLFSANIAFDDHPFGRRAAGMIDTVTVESVLQFLRVREGMGQEVVVR
ncbi:MAG: DUF2145 domain-containing protein [Bdellovibrionales bacterium]|nr:DUF2145 domain-containing protein [Massilia sp.]